MRLDVTGDQRLTAMVRALRYLDREWVKVWQLKGKQELTPEWDQQLERSGPNRLQRAALVRTSSVALNRRGILLRSGGKGKLAAVTKAAEFGVDQRLRSRYRRKDKPVPAPDSHVVTRRTGTPFHPPKKGGYVVWPALGRFVPRAAAFATDLFYDLMRKIPGVG